MSESETPSKIILAKWTDRFFAWFIDFIIISSISAGLIFGVLGSVELEEEWIWAESTQFIPSSLMFFVYWTILEYKTGQTIGKKILNLRLVNLHGEKPSLKGVMIGSFGKSFLLPFDVILGWFMTNEKRQRIFNKLGDTVVIKIKEPEDDSNLKYLKD